MNRAAWLAILCAACAVGPDFERPAPPAVSQYLPGPGQAALSSKIPADWWALFRNEKLDATLKQVIASNHSLVAAEQTLAAAREAIAIARSGFYPQLDLTAAVHGSTQGVLANLFSVGPTASYNLDVFGGTRRHVEQEEALAELQRYELAAAYLTLSGSAVTEAIQIASVRLQIATVQDLIANDQKNLDLVQREFDAGKVAKSDVYTAAAQLATDRTALPSLRQQLALARHALAVLNARAPGEWTPPDFDFAELALPNPMPMSLPSELVRQRPDVLAAEAQLHANSAAIGVATAQLYPSITLSASLTRNANALADLFTSAGSNILAGGGAFDLPLFRGGALNAQKNAAIDLYQAQFATWQQTVLQAFQQVADSLSALENDADAVASTHDAANIAGDSLALQRISFAAGKTSALQLIVAENTYSNARLGYVKAQGQQMTDVAALFVALGGGWWNSDDFTAAANPARDSQSP